MDPVLVRLLAVAAFVAAVAAWGLWWRRRDGRVRPGAPEGSAAGRFRGEELAAVGLDTDGDGVQGVLLTSPTCAPCRTVRRILDEAAVARPTFRWVAVDAADHLPIARRHHVLRVPTLFLLDAGGRILARTSGVPATRDVVGVIDRAEGAAPADPPTYGGAAADRC